MSRSGVKRHIDRGGGGGDCGRDMADSWTDGNDCGDGKGIGKDV